MLIRAITVLDKILPSDGVCCTRGERSGDLGTDGDETVCPDVAASDEIGALCLLRRSGVNLRGCMAFAGLVT